MRRVVEPFKDATEDLEGDYIALPLAPCIMSVLAFHIEAEIAAIVSGKSSANAAEVMLVTAWTNFPMSSRSLLPSAHAPKASSGLTRLKGLRGAAFFSRSVTSRIKRTSPGECGRGGRLTESEVRGTWCGRGRDGQEEAEERNFEYVCGDGVGSGCGRR